MKKVIAKWNIQNIIVTLCFFAVCLGTQQMQTKKWDSGLLQLCEDMTGALMAIVILSNYKWSDFVKYKVPYLIWTIVGVIGMAVGIPMGIANRYSFLAADTVALAVGIFLMGYCVLHTIISVVVEKYRPQFFKPLFILWIVMMLWMIFSKSEYLWVECYFVMFLCYYLTEQTPAQRKNCIGGMVNGIILGFLVIQGHAFLCRPYDIARYQGNFCNPNHNCMFLCMCMVAIMGKILMGVRERRKWWLQTIYYLMLAVCLSFIFMTGCRSGYLSVFVITIFFLLGYCRVKRKIMFFRMGILLVALFIVMMPVTYLGVRYLPTIHPHVVFYFQEGYSETRVHSWDPRDSEKFISFEEMLNTVLGRFSTFIRAFDFFEMDAVDLENAYKLDARLRLASAGEYFPDLETEADKAGFTKHVDPDRVPALTASESSNAFLVRYTIYKWYFKNLSLRGMPYHEQGFQLTENHWIQDTHNIYLYYGIDFGWPAMIMFTVFIWWGIGRLVGRGLKMRDVETLACLFVVMLPPIFGMFEFAWGSGMISTIAFYFAFKEIFNVQVLNETNEEKQDN